MRKVFIEMEKLKDPYSGLGQFCYHLGKSLLPVAPPSLDLRFYVPSSKLGIFGNEQRYIPESKWHRYFGIREKFKVWHCLHQESKYLPAGKETKMILTIHDLNFLHTGKNSLKVKHRLAGIQKRINKAAAITTISHYSASEIRSHLVIPDIPLKVIYNGNNLPPDPPFQKPSLDPGAKFFFTIGIIAPKKNFHTLVPVLQRLQEYSLVIAGNNTHAYADEIMMLAKEAGVADRVLLPGPVTEKEKIWLYRHCTAFLFPSIAEGFGLPVVEAMSLGRPVFISDKTSLPEIGGDAAFCFRSFDPDDMTQVIMDGLKAFERDPSLKIKLTERASMFSWENAAKEYAQLYTDI